MRILTVLTYYRPYTSGLTIYAERLARALVNRGHEVTVLTSQYDSNLPRTEISHGVRVVRVPVWFRLSKGVIMPTIGLIATREVLNHDVVVLHLPQFDAAGIALRGRLLNKPTVLTYHCDVTLPSGLFNRLANHAVHLMNHMAARFAHRIVTYTQDYADHSPFATRYKHKLTVITPPVELPDIEKEDVVRFQAEHNPNKRSPVIGMAARFATEKGVEILLDALPTVITKYPETLVLYAGQYQDVLGEEGYIQRLSPVVNEYISRGNWKFLDVLTPTQMAAFYPNLDVLVVPSLNSTEAFGLVQIEAMMNGTPSIASALPGVRQPVKMTGMGEVVPIGDSEALAEALLAIFANPQEYAGDPLEVANRFKPDVTASAYEALFKSLEER